MLETWPQGSPGSVGGEPGEKGGNGPLLFGVIGDSVLAAQNAIARF